MKLEMIYGGNLVQEKETGTQIAANMPASSKPTWDEIVRRVNLFEEMVGFIEMVRNAGDWNESYHHHANEILLKATTT